jgi:hypothetical protein
MSRWPVRGRGRLRLEGGLDALEAPKHFNQVSL